MKTYTTILGGGLAGLTAAAALAKRGVRVRLYEKRRELGGRAASSTEDGFTFNFGPHALYRNGAAMATFEAWGIVPKGGVPDVSDGGYFIRDGERYTLPLGLRSLAMSRLLSASEKFEFARAFHKINTQRPSTAEGLTVSEWLDRHVSKARVREVMLALIRVSTYSNEPGLLSMAATMRQVQVGAGGVLYLDGGWQTIVDSLAGLARKLGVEIHSGETPAELPPNAILAIPPAEIEQLTGATLPSRKALRMACFDLALSSVPPDAGRFALGVDQPLYFSMHSRWARLAPEGGALVQVGRYLGQNDNGSRAELEQLCDLVMPGWRDRVVTARYLPEMTVTHAMPEVTPRPSITALGIEGVYIAGDWVGSHGMLADAAVSSALGAASASMTERRAAA